MRRTNSIMKAKINLKTHSIMYYLALNKNAINVSLHIFPRGGHQIALRNNSGSANLWTVLCEEWLREMGFL